MLTCGMVLFKVLGKSPVEGFKVFFLQPMADRYGVAELFLKATPLMLCAVGLSVGFRGNVWNIGAEGQLLMGALAGGGLALHFPASQSPFLLPAMFVAGALGGMLWAAIPAWLRTRFNANEILTSLMLVYIAELVVSWLVHGPWKDPDGFNFPQTRLFQAKAIIPVLVEGTRVNAALLGRVAMPASRPAARSGWACWWGAAARAWRAFPRWRGPSGRSPSTSRRATASLP